MKKNREESNNPNIEEIDMMETDDDKEFQEGNFEDFKKEGGSEWEWSALCALSDIIEAIEEHCEKGIDWLKQHKNTVKPKNWHYWWNTTIQKDWGKIINVCSKNVQNTQNVNNHLNKM